MSDVSSVQIGNLFVEGYNGDYVFEILKETNDFYEAKILREWLPYLEKSKVILDIGANLGNHTLFWAINIPYEKIFAFEPLSANYEILSTNIEKNNLWNVIAINKGVGDKEGFSTIENFDESNYGGTSLTKSVDSNGDIPITTIDKFSEDLKIESIDFVKIDTEGFEVYVLEGMKKTLEKDLPDLWIEVSSETFKDIMDLLLPLGYILTDLEGCNMLFLHPNRHESLNTVPIEKILNAALYNLERTNCYYQNYTKSKEWLETRNHQIKRENIQFNEVKKQLKETHKSLNEIESQLEEVETQLKIKGEQWSTIDKYQKQLINSYKGYYQDVLNELTLCIEDYDLAIEETERLSNEIKQLKADNNYLQSRIDIIKNNKLGALAIKAYHQYEKFLRRGE